MENYSGTHNLYEGGGIMSCDPDVCLQRSAECIKFKFDEDELMRPTKAIKLTKVLETLEEYLESEK
jgi:hypothetical protein